MNISEVSTLNLAVELTRRQLHNPDGSLPYALYMLGNKMKPNVTADGIAARRNAQTGLWELGMIRRDNKQEPGKLVPIGGNVYPGESRIDAQRRHWMTDLGHRIRIFPPWDHYPLEFAYGPPDADGNPRPGFIGVDSEKYSMSVTYVVELVEPDKPFVFGEGPGGREARSFEWGITPDTSNSEFGYNCAWMAKECLRRLGELYP